MGTSGTPFHREDVSGEPVYAQAYDADRQTMAKDGSARLLKAIAKYHHQRGRAGWGHLL